MGFLRASVLFLILCAANAMISNDKITINSKERFSVLWSFEFAAGGTLEMAISMDNTTSMQQRNNSIQFLFCTDQQIDPLRTARLEDVCNVETFNFVTCLWQGQLGLGYGLAANFSKNATTQSWYRLLQLNCDEGDFQGRLSYVAINPGGEYLSLSEVPFKTLYVVTGAMWTALLLIWCWNWFRYRFFNVHLQRLISVVPLSKALISCTYLFYWRQGSSTGEFPIEWGRANYVMAILDLCCFFGSLLMIAKGWMITRGSLAKFESRRITAMIILLMVSKAIYTWINGFVLFFLVIMYVLMLRYIFASIVDNTTTLSNQIAVLRTIPSLNVTKTPVWTKQKMYKRFQVAMVIFISVDVIFHLWATIFLSATPWVEDTMEHFISALLVISVGYTFAMRPFNPFFFRVVRHHEQTQWNPVTELYDDPNLPATSSSSSVSSSARSMWSGITSGLQKTRKTSLLITGLQSDADEQPASGPYMWRPGMPVPKMPSPSQPESWFSWFLGLDTNASGPGLIIETASDDCHDHVSRQLFLAEAALDGPPLHIQGLASPQPPRSHPSSSAPTSLETDTSSLVGRVGGGLRPGDLEMKDFTAISVK